jgi:hypothetical protein
MTCRACKRNQVSFGNLCQKCYEKIVKPEYRVKLQPNVGHGYGVSKGGRMVIDGLRKKDAEYIVKKAKGKKK